MERLIPVLPTLHLHSVKPVILLEHQIVATLANSYNEYFDSMSPLVLSL